MEDLDCQDVVEMVTDYLEDALLPNERMRLEEHLKECDGCDAYMTQINRVRLSLGKVDLNQVEPAVRARFIETFRSWKNYEPS